jgi:hypothetical protein
MPYLTLTLSGQPVDLPADAQVALSYRVNDLRSLDSREAAFSETFTLPNTAQVRAVLGNPHSLDSLTSAPYQLLPAILRSPGGVVLLDGFAILESSGEGFDVTLTDAIGSLFSQVGDRKLRELDLSKWDHILNYASVQDAQNNGYTEGYTYPIADTGILVNRNPEHGVSYSELPVATYVHAVLQGIVSQALPGYRLTGTLLEETLYRFLAVPQATPRLQMRTSYLAPFKLRAFLDLERTYTLETDPATKIQFTKIQQGQLFGGTLYQPPPHPITYKAELKVPVRFESSLGVGGVSFVSLVLLADDGTGSPPTMVAGVAVTKQGDSTATFSVDNIFVQGSDTTTLYLAISWGNGVGPASLTLRKGGSLALTPQPRTYPGAPVHLDACLPDKSQADFLKLVFNQFNIIAQADSAFKTVRFDLFNDLERNRRRAVNWTSKLDFTARPRLEYRLDDYAQRNLLSYAEAPDAYTEELLLPPAPFDAEPRGEATLPVINATIAEEREAYTADAFLVHDHDTLTKSQPLPWLPFFEAKDTLTAPVRPYDPDIDYVVTTGYVLYQGRYWFPRKGGTSGQSSKPPRLGEDWLLVEDAVIVEPLNSDLNTVAVIALYDPAVTPVVVMGEGEAERFVPTATLVREGLTFSDLLENYYPGLTKALARVQLLTVDARLNALDIADLDFTIPVQVGPVDIPGYGRLAAVCYLNNIDQYQPGNPGAVEVELLVLGLPVPGLAPAVPMPLPTQAFITEDAAAYLLTEAGYYLLLEQD